jgi:hypothetical protein
VDHPVLSNPTYHHTSGLLHSLSDTRTPEEIWPVSGERRVVVVEKEKEEEEEV